MIEPRAQTEFCQGRCADTFRRLIDHPLGETSRIRTDNGQPFASNALGRLSTLSVW
jgi:hypothetical protein